MEAEILDFNRAHVANSDVSMAVNAAMDAAYEAQEKEARRPYLGASIIGHECLRRVQYDWQVTSTHPARTHRIFQRGHSFEEISARMMAAAGFRIERGTPATGFAAADGDFRGHVDGIVHAGPDIPGLGYPCLWEHKALGSSGWKKLERDGLAKAYPQYADQVAIYQAYLALDEHPALFTAVNADTCEVLHLAIPFNAQRAQAASDRAVLVIKATRAHELLDRVTDKETDWRCKMCPHKTRCWA